ncbi:MAG: DUF4346 domain-containing protein [Promethearchaeota archaeon]
MGEQDRIIWFITGEIASPVLEKMLEGKEKRYRVMVAPVSVASFLTRKHMGDLLATHPGAKRSFMIIPGTVKWDTTKFNEENGTAIIKGPRNLNDVPQFLKILEKILSEQGDASREDITRAIRNARPGKEKLEQECSGIMKERETLFLEFLAGRSQHEKVKYKENFDIMDKFKRKFRNFCFPNSELIIGKDFQPIVMAEIINAPGKELDLIDAEASRFLSNGADIIDVGGTPGKSKPEEIAEITRYIIDEHSCLVSIDSLDEKEIFAAVEAGASAILSIDQGNKEILHSLDTGLVLVIIPTNMKKGYLPPEPSERVAAVEELIFFAQDAGFSKLLADPIINSPIIPGLIKSLEAFTMFSHDSKKDERLDVPMFIGGSNVSEMIDTDSTGVNAMLSVIGVELGAGILFTSEDSMKCLGSVSEMVAASKLSFRARIKQTHPKDLGIHVFNSKNKSRPFELFDPEELEEFRRAIPAEIKSGRFKPDPSGLYFKIMVDYFKREVLVAAYHDGIPVAFYSGHDSSIIGKSIIAAFPNLSSEHFMYLGREMARAEQALRFNSPFSQDSEM